MRDNDYLSGNFAPIGAEHTLDALAVTGAVPAALNGALYRVGPNLQFAPRDEHYHWFSGDGMIHAFFIGGGKVAYANRWARTPKWELEHRAGRALFGTFGNPATSDPAVHGQSSGTANTNIVWHGGRLFALEESHQAFEIDPLTLASLGYRDFGGERFTAHPRHDPLTGELHFFSYSAAGPGTRTMQYGVLDQRCAVKRLASFDAPYASMAHDFMLTQGHVLFPVLPLTASIDRAMKGLPYFAWEKERCARIGILPRGAPVAQMRWFEGAPCHAFHMMNAWDEGDTIVAYVMQSDAAPGLPNADGTPHPPAKTVARLCRWTFDLGTGRFASAYLDDLVGEFPRIDERYATVRNRVGFYCCHAQARDRDGVSALLYDSVARYDFDEGTRQLYTLPDGDALSEPVFVPRSANAPEGDGWLLAVVWRAREGRSDLLILDACDLHAGPVAVAALPHRLPFGFHGNWRPNV